MDPILREKLEVAMSTEINSAVALSEIDDVEASEASADFLEILDGFQNEREFIEEFAVYISKYPFSSPVGDYYMAQIKEHAKEGDIQAIRDQLQAYTKP